MRVLIVFLLLLTSCSRSASPAKAHQETFPAGPPIADYIQFNYAVYLPPGNAQNQTQVERLIRTRYKTLKLVEKLPERPSETFVSPHVITDVHKTYIPPSIESLKYRGVGLSEQQKQALQKSRRAIILEFAHPKTSLWPGLRTATELVEALARQTGGLVFDEETRQVFTPGSWHKRRLEAWTADVPQVSHQFTIDLYPLGEYHREVTLGMAKLGLPDLVVQELPETSDDQASNLINSVAQTLAEGQTINSSGKLRLDLDSIRNVAFRDNAKKWLMPNALSTACVVFKPGIKDEGDPNNRLLELSADLYSGPDPHAKLENLFSSLFGWKDAARKVHHTQEVLEESKKERAKLPELRKAFVAGLGSGEYIQVKAPFPTPNGNHEWMWVEITRWRGKAITGTLENEPAEIPDLRSGQMVEVSEDDVFDYIRRFPDGHTEGNTTGPILDKLQYGTEPTMRSRGEMPKCD
jgi:uncharacterized protein YegJ (DUF2314 family)